MIRISNQFGNPLIQKKESKEKKRVRAIRCQNPCVKKNTLN
jgi:hypothetical protein